MLGRLRATRTRGVGGAVVLTPASASTAASSCLYSSSSGSSSRIRAVISFLFSSKKLLTKAPLTGNGVIQCMHTSQTALPLPVENGNLTCAMRWSAAAPEVPSAVAASSVPRARGSRRPERGWRQRRAGRTARESRPCSGIACCRCRGPAGTRCARWTAPGPGPPRRHDGRTHTGQRPANPEVRTTQVDRLGHAEALADRAARHIGDPPVDRHPVAESIGVHDDRPDLLGRGTDQR